jgi:hypothetical protein
MKVLVITPTLGASDWLEKTLVSVAAHRGACRHVLVAPADRRPALASRFPEVTVISERGGGMYAAINTALAGCGDWDAFTYVNDDDLLLPGFARVLAAVAPGGGARPQIAYGGVRLIDGQGRRLGAIPISPEPGLNRLLYAQRLEPVYQQGTLVTRAAAEATGRFDEALRYCGDSEFLARACVRGVPFVRATGREVAAFRLRAGQLTKDRPAMIAERARVDEKLGLIGRRPAGPMRLARWRFRWANLPIYTERIRRHGFLTFDELLARVG